MKKRLLVLLMALAMCFAMFGCGSEEAAPEEGTEEPVAEEPSEATPEEEAQPEENTEEPAPEEGTEAQPE